MAKRWFHWKKLGRYVEIDTTRTCKNCGAVHPYLGGESYTLRQSLGAKIICPVCDHEYEMRTSQEIVLGLIEHIGHVEAERDYWKNLWYNGGYKNRPAPRDRPWDIKAVDGSPTIVSGPALCPKCGKQQVELHAGVLYPGNDLPHMEIRCPDCGPLQANPYEPSEDPINKDAPPVKPWAPPQEQL